MLLSRLVTPCAGWCIVVCLRRAHSNPIQSSKSDLQPVLPTINARLADSTATVPASQAASSAILRPLPLSTAAPDLLGFAQVSGVYGPGTWLAWHLTLVGAWWRLFSDRSRERRLDLNTWLSLFGLNWAAVDVLRQLAALRAISLTHHTYTAEVSSHMARYGAALTMVFWGFWYGANQLILGMSYSFETPGHRRWSTTVSGGLTLPLIALLASLYLFRLQVDSGQGLAIDLLPFLFSPRVNAKDHALHCGLSLAINLMLIWIVADNVARDRNIFDKFVAWLRRSTVLQPCVKSFILGPVFGTMHIMHIFLKLTIWFGASLGIPVSYLIVTSTA